MFEAGKEAARIEDKKIVALFFQRSEHAISELDKKYGALCRRLAFQITGSRQDAEECVNDAYLGAWRAIPPVEPDPLPAFVCKIVRNLSVKRYQSNQAAKRKSSLYRLPAGTGILPARALYSGSGTCRKRRRAYARRIFIRAERGKPRYFFAALLVFFLV